MWCLRWWCRYLHQNLGRPHQGFGCHSTKITWKCYWFGYWRTPRGLKPWREKIDTILHMYRPRTPTELRIFIGCFNYFRDMWLSCAHILKTLNDKSGLKKRYRLEWTDEMHMKFNKMIILMAADTLAGYPNHNKRFDIYTETSDF